MGIKRKHKIGFASKYYTLWLVVEGESYTVFSYMQNLSISEGKAISKFQKMYPDENPIIDYALFGSTSFTKQVQKKYNPDEFSFGKLSGQKISESDDEWQLCRARNDEDTETRRGLAHNRLIELGRLVEYKGEWMTPENKASFERETEKLAGHAWYYEDKKRVTLEGLNIEDFFYFDTDYGSAIVMTFVALDGKKFKYLGTSHPSFKTEDEEGCINYTLYKNVSNIKLVGTINHTDYKGRCETRIKRIKIKSFDINI